MKIKMTFVMLVLSAVILCGLKAQDYSIEPSGDTNNILPLWEQAKFMERQLKWRQKHVLPEVMRREDVDMWIVGRNEGVIYLSLIPGDKEGLVPEEPHYLVFYDKGEKDGVELIFGERDSLSKIVSARTPKKIGVNDQNKEQLEQTLGETMASKFISSRNLTIGFLEKRSPEEISVFHYVTRIAHDVIAEAYSNRVVIPDVTTTDELNWWIRQRYRDLGLLTSDHPTITMQRSFEDRKKYAESDEHFRVDIPPRNGYNTVIRRGDIISCDTGINYLGLGTDTQQVAYVLRKGETDAPEGLKKAMARTNRLQDLFAAEFKDGRSGNDIWLSALRIAKAEDLRPSIYSHPIPLFIMRYELNGGFYENVRYGAGPGLGREGSEEPTRRGEYPVYLNTVYAMELDTKTSIAEWGGQDIRVVLEQTVAFSKKGIEYLGGRQTKWYLIK
ncbi:MAG: M24 family metallopeptidase [Candidatus Aminicenantaceae bacterium]